MGGEIGGPPLADALAPHRLAGTVVVGRQRGVPPPYALPLRVWHGRNGRVAGWARARTHSLRRQESGGSHGPDAAWVARACPPPPSHPPTHTDMWVSGNPRK